MQAPVEVTGGKVNFLQRFFYPTFNKPFVFSSLQLRKRHVFISIDLTLLYGERVEKVLIKYLNYKKAASSNGNSN